MNVYIRTRGLNHEISDQGYLVAKSPRCDTCTYVLPSYTASTGLRCGLEYSRSSALMRKLRKMDFYPTVKPNNACEMWIAEEVKD